MPALTDLLAQTLLPETLQLAAVLDVVRGAIMVIFIVVSFLVILVVLAQEGKGGGLAGAFGGAGADAFGVKAGTVNKFTAWLAGLFLGLALLHAGLSTATSAPVSELDTSTYDSETEDKKGADKGAPGAPEDADGKAEAADPKKAGDKGEEPPKKPADDNPPPKDDGK